MASVLVTGGAGFIGSHLVEALVARGDSVRVLDDLSTGVEANLASVEEQVEMVVGDLRDLDQVNAAVEGVELIYHQAAFVSPPLSVEDPQTCYQVNIQGTSNLLEAARRVGVQRVVLASSAAVYGENPSLPLKESLSPQPLSPYAASKQVNEVFAQLYTHSLGLPVVALRYFNVYGPRQSPHSDYAAAIPIFIRRALEGKVAVIYGDGSQSRDFIYIDDVVQANLIAAQAPKAPGMAFNVCSGREVSLLDLLAALRSLLPEVLEPKFDDPRAGDIYRSLGDPTLAAELLGFRAETTLEDGLARTVEWMQP